MAFRLGARVRETSTAPGTGSFTTNGAVQGAQSLSSVLTSNGDTCWYGATNGTGWEEGTLTRVSATSYSRSIDTSSNSNTAVNFSTGLVDIYLDLPSFVADTLNLIEITVASATTTDIGAVKGAKILISGTTTIAGLGASLNKLRFVRFSGILTLTHNATSLILPGAANITTAAGDTAIFMSDASGNWRCYLYQRAASLPINKVVIQRFTASGTYTPSAGMQYCVIETLGGGQGGGGTSGNATGYGIGGGGGSGSRSLKTASAATIGASQTVTIGAAGNGGAAGVAGVAGGDTSVGSLCIGKGAPSTANANNSAGAPGGTGGVAGTGDVTTVGATASPGGAGTVTTVSPLGGVGASSPYGGGGIAGNVLSGNVATGAAATGFGAGGAGGLSYGSATGAAGGPGSPGLAIITEYCSQ